MATLWQRAQASGLCPPSLLGKENEIVDADGFAEDVRKLLAGQEFYLQADEMIAPEFSKILTKVSSVADIVSADPAAGKSTLDFRRCILLAIVGATPAGSPSVDRILADGYLDNVKSWLDDTLSTPEGGIDMLLHLLSNIAHLPVTKTVVKGSGMGKAIGSIEKHSKCKGTPNETAISERVQQVKDAWQASVKAKKPNDAVSIKESASSPKRPVEVSASSPAAKRAKAEPEQKATAFSSLLKKVQKPTANGISTTKSEPKLENNGTSTSLADTNQASGQQEKKVKKTVTAKRVKWADHFGQPISLEQTVEGESVEGHTVDSSVSWTDRKKRDRMREKELLAKAKKSKLLDDDVDLLLPQQIKPVVQWRTPLPLSERTDITRAVLESTEVSAQIERMKTAPKVLYSLEYDVPNSPAPLSDVEQALDMTSQSSAVNASIPFFVPTQPVATETQAIAYAAPTVEQISNLALSLPPVQDPSIATPDFVQSLGLPMFLVGQPVQALQTLAGSPGLLSTLVDANGMYDQQRLMSLVYTLSSSSAVSPPAPAPFAPIPNNYNALVPTAHFGQPQQQQPPFRGAAAGGFRRSDDGNLHVSGFGPTTTEADLMVAFAPYVQVDEVVMKGNFAFVNTSDPANAIRAKECLTGTLVGGMPIRINNATRKPRENSLSHYGSGAAESVAPYPGKAIHGVPGPHRSGRFGNHHAPAAPTAPGLIPSVPGIPPSAPGMPLSVPGMPPLAPNMPAPVPNADSVRDDRGNPATKNLFVAGYGPGTTEQQLRELIGQFAIVTGVVAKGAFSFVNTTDRNDAVLARERLGGTMFNGGTLRINFAKETGRLGTSFDLTYNAATARSRGGPQPAAMNYYGRGGGF